MSETKMVGSLFTRLCAGARYGFDNDDENGGRLSLRF